MGSIGGSSTEDIDAPITEVWALIEDILTAPEWQDGLLTMEALERDAQGRATLVEGDNDARIRIIRSRVRVTYEAPVSMRWVQEHGDLKSAVGSWTLEALGDGRTRATYALEVDPGRVLGMLARGPIVDLLRNEMVKTRAGELKRWAEGG